MTTANVPKTIASWRIEAVVSRDTLGTVYRAMDRRLDHQVALTVLAPDLARTDADRERFLHRVELASTLEHPNVLTVYEGGETGASLFLVTRWVDGVDLHARIASGGPLAPAEAVGTLQPVARALSAAHRHGLVHGAVSSANVLLAFGERGGGRQVYLGGFAIAPPADVANGVAGDVAALGSLLFEALTGQAPDEQQTEAMRTDPGLVSRRLNTIASGAGAGLATVIARALADPADRFSSAEELVLALERERAAARAASLASEPRRSPEEYPAGADGQPPAGAVVPQAWALAEPRGPGGRRTARVAGVLAATVLTVVLVVALATYNRAPHRSATAPALVRPTTALATVSYGHLSVPQKINLGSRAGGLSVTQSSQAWVSVAAESKIVEIPPDQPPLAFSGIPDPGPIAAGSAGVWVTLSGAKAVARWADGQLRDRVALRGRSVAIALDPRNNSAWVADATGGISHVVGPTASAATTSVSPPAVSLAIGAPNWIWAVNGRLVRIDPNNLDSRTFNGGPGAVGVAVNQGIWLARTDGSVARFDPRPGHLQSVVALTAPASLSGIAARQGSPFVWAISAAARSL